MLQPRKALEGMISPPWTTKLNILYLPSSVNPHAGMLLTCFHLLLLHYSLTSFTKNFNAFHRQSIPMTKLAAGEEEKKLGVCEIIKEEIFLLKWRVLIFACFLTFGSYYIYDFPGSIGTGPEHTIQALFASKCKAYNQAMNLALYSVYSWPNSVLAMVGGILIDKFLGLRRAMLLFCFLVTLGAALFYVGVLVTNYPLMLFARVVFGLGGESLSVAQSAFIARWFKNGRGMALAFGITISFARVGSSFNFLFSPMISKHIDVNTAVAMGLAACGFSLISCFALIWMDVIGTRRGEVPPEARENATPFSLKEIKELTVLLWIACGICVFAYCALFPFVGVAENFFQVKFGVDHDVAGRYVSLYQFTSAGGSPVVGFLVDNVGRFCYWIITACSGFILVHVLLIFTMIPGEVMMVSLGILYSFLVSSLWPSIPYCVEPAFVGFAYGVITALQNFGLASFPLMVGATLDTFTPAQNATIAPVPIGNLTNAPTAHHSRFHNIQALLGASDACVVANTTKPPLPTLEGYKYAELIFILSAGIAVLLGVALTLCDRAKHHGILGASPARRAEIKKILDGETQDLLNSEKSTDERYV